MKKKKLKINLNNILTILFIGVSFYLIRSISIFSKIENLLRYSIILFLLLIDIALVVKLCNYPKKKKKKEKKFPIYPIVLVLVTILYFVIGFNLNEIYSYFTRLNKKVVYSTSLVTLKDTPNIDLITLKDKKIGIISDTSSEDGYILAQEIIQKENLKRNNELVSYHEYLEMITALYEKEVDYIFLPTDYADIYGTTEGFENLKDTLKTVTTTEKETTKSEAKLSGSSKDISEPFTILLIGIDSTQNGLKQADSFNGDSLTLVTFNPSTMTATMLTVPRDSYVPIACFKGQYENKITHSAARGTSCVINTIENFLDIKIDYYMKINFTGLVDLVNEIGGIDVEVPYSFCEQNSKREFGENMIYVKKGFQTLNGEEALALSRNRKKNTEFCSSEWTQGYRDDFVRANNQQMVIQAVLDKMKTFTDISRLKGVLNVLADNLDTNMTEDTMFSFYNIAKDVMLSSSNDEVLTIQKLFIDGMGQMIYDESTRMRLWNYIPNKKSVEEVINAMKINLGEKEHSLIKEFHYSMKDGYTAKVIGKGPYSVYTTYDLLPDLTKKSLKSANEWADKYQMKLQIEYVENSKYSNDTILKQNYPVDKRLDKIDKRTVTIQVVKNKEVVTTPQVDCLEDEENSVCKVPNFLTKKKSDVTTWAKQFSNSVAVSFLYEESEETAGTIIDQSVKKGTTVKELVEENITLTITIAKEKKEEDSSLEE